MKDWACVVRWYSLFKSWHKTLQKTFTVRKGEGTLRTRLPAPDPPSTAKTTFKSNADCHILKGKSPIWFCRSNFEGQETSTGFLERSYSHSCKHKVYEKDHGNYVSSHMDWPRFVKFCFISFSPFFFLRVISFLFPCKNRHPYMYRRQIIHVVTIVTDLYGWQWLQYNDEAKDSQMSICTQRWGFDKFSWWDHA